MKQEHGRAAHWARLSRAWEKSGQTQSEFCAARGVELGTFRWWRWRLGAGQGGLLPEPEAAGSSWVEVSREGSGEQPGPDTGSSRELRLVFCDGLEIRVPAGFDTETLRKVLTVLGEVVC